MRVPELDREPFSFPELTWAHLKLLSSPVPIRFGFREV
jgi:hypothetical protein